jgi:hypothetical protein
MHTFLKVLWKHSFPNEPIVLYSEIDSERWEVRKIEIFSHGHWGFADMTENFGTTRLGEVPIPSLSEIAQDTEFDPSEITKSEFEQLWSQRKTKSFVKLLSEERTRIGHPVSFAILDAKQGAPPPIEPNEDGFPLPAWYRKVYSTPFSELSFLDFSRALDQNIHVDEVVPVVIEILRNDILAGDWYDGQLLSSLSRLPQEFWKNHPDLASQINQQIAGELAGLDEAVKADGEQLLQRTAH